MEHHLTNTSEMLEYSGIFFSCYSECVQKCFHAQKDHALVYIYSGELLIEDRNKNTTISAGECAFIRRDHRLVMNKCGKDGQPYKGITLNFNRATLRTVFTQMKKLDLPKNAVLLDEYVISIDPSPDITSLFQSLTPYFDLNTQPTNQVVYLKLLEAIYATLNNSSNFYPLLFDFADPWKIDILEFLNKNFMDDLSTEQIASYTGRSLSTLKRDFKKVSNLTPEKWLTKKRLELAYQKLSKGRKVKDVYLEVGFKNPSHFSTAFKKQYGFSPAKLVLLQQVNL